MYPAPFEITSNTVQTMAALSGAITIYSVDLHGVHKLAVRVYVHFAFTDRRYLSTIGNRYFPAISRFQPFVRHGVKSTVHMVRGSNQPSVSLLPAVLAAAHDAFVHVRTIEGNVPIYRKCRHFSLMQSYHGFLGRHDLL